MEISEVECLRYAVGALRENPDSPLMREGRLDSWKEIASYLGRGVRTVQRWEREEGLPVHRLAHEKRGSVYARRDELDSWWESRRTTLAVSTSADIDEALDDAPDDAGDSLQPTTVSRRRIPRRGLIAAGVALAVLSVIGGIRLWRQNAASASVPRFERVTSTSARTFSPALSSDGRMLAYVSDGGQDGTSPQIWLQQIGGAAIRLTSDQRESADLAFSADDTRLIFTATDDEGRNVYDVPTLGGEARLLKRAATGARFSPDGRLLVYVSSESRQGLRIAAADGTGDRTIAPGLVDVLFGIWSLDSRYLLVHAHPDPKLEPDWWVVPLDGSPPINSGIIRHFRDRSFTVLTSPPAWVGDSLVFTASSTVGVNLWRQRLAPTTFEAVGDPEQLTYGVEQAVFPVAAGERLAFVSVHTDINLWSAAVDVATGMANGVPRRLTRGTGILSHLSVTKDGRTLAYFSTRARNGDVFLRDLENGSETVLSAEAGKGYPALSPSGSQLAYGTRVPGARAMRPIFVVTLPAGAPRKLCDDCGGRPRQWLDERLLLIERFGSNLNTIALLDTTNGAQRELLASVDRSLSNPRISPDGEWVAFDAARPGGLPSVIVAPLGRVSPIPESEWMVVDQFVSHPFWSGDGRLLYYLSTGDAVGIRSVVRARHFGGAPKAPHGDAFSAYASHELVVPTQFPGTTPLAISNQLLFVLGDFRGDVWTMDLGPR